MHDPLRSAPALEQVAAWQHAVGRAHAESSALADPFAHRELSRRLSDISTLLAEVEDADDVDAALLESVERTLALVTGARDSIAGDAFASGAGRRARDVLVSLERAITSARLPTADVAATHGHGRSERVRYGVTASGALPALGDPDRAILFSPHQAATAEDGEIDPAQAWRQFPSGVSVPSRSGIREFSPEAAARADITVKMCSAFEEIGSLGSIRKPSPEEPWSPEARLDRRLLAHFDAALTLARPIKLFIVSEQGDSRAARIHVDIGATLLQWSDDAVPGDERRAFARAFVLGSLRGRDAARVATAALGDPDTSRADAAANALALASSPDLAESLMAACLHPASAARAFEVSARRGEVDVPTATVGLAGAGVEIATSAAHALGSSTQRDLALAVLERAVQTGVEPEVELAACRSALALGAAWALRAARERASLLPSDDPLLTGWLELLGVAGDLRDASILRERAGDDPARIAAWGFHGSVELARTLVERIEGMGRGRDPVHHLRALERIAGIGSAGFDDASGVAQSWRSLSGSLDPAARYRKGRPFTLVSSLEELRAEGTLHGDRRQLALEVSLLTRGGVRVDVDGWTARQTALIASAIEDANAVRAPIGRFNASALG